MGKKIHPEQIRRYWRWRGQGLTREAAAKKANFSLSFAAGLERRGARGDSSEGFEEKQPGPVPLDQLSDIARDCLDDFSRFRARYLGSVSVPWQEEAAQRLKGLYQSPRDEYICMNVAQGGGKTRFFHDVSAWLTAYDRTLRGIQGSLGLKMSNALCGNLRDTLTRTAPVLPRQLDLDRGLAVAAQATLIQDYGTFKPTSEEDSLWRRDQFTVAQHGAVATANKEPTWAAFSYEAKFLGWRVDCMIWDDLVNTRMLRNPDAVEALYRWWDDEAESRLDPGGLCVIVGQRLRSNDIYRYVLDKVAVDELEEGETPDQYTPKMYTHIVYKAHYPELCNDEHGRDAPAYLEGGCLLDPPRVTWQKCLGKIAAGNFEVVFQQEDSDPSNVLVPKVWIDGGQHDGVTHLGAWDNDRRIGQLPLIPPSSFVIRVMTVDPSPTKYWGILDWLYVLPPNTEPLAGTRYLINICRAKMGANEFLDFSRAHDGFVGLAEEWVQAAKKDRYPITHLILEKNAAQRWAQQYLFFQEWARSRGVQTVEHETMRNKADEEFGIWQTIPNAYQHGRVNLPAEHGSQARHAVYPLVAELTTYPDGATDDLVMSQWFLEFNLQHLVRARHRITNMQPDKPAWVRKLELTGASFG